MNNENLQTLAIYDGYSYYTRDFFYFILEQLLCLKLIVTFVNI